jgi:hypothetical protein
VIGLLVLVTCAMSSIGLVGCGGAEPAGDLAGELPVPPDGVVLDGGTWSRVEDPDGVFGIEGERTVHLSDVAVGGPGYVAVGSVGEGRYGEGGTVAAVWSSADGAAWERVPHDDAVFGKPGTGAFTAAAAVTRGGPGLVAVGVEAHGEALVALAWLSEDGRHWTRVEVDDPRRRDATDLSLHAIHVTDDGLVAVGIERGGDDGDEERPAVWQSPDGTAWSLVELHPADDATRWGYLSTLTAHDGQLVAAGASGGPGSRGWVATVWHGSPADGLTRIPHDDTVFGGPGMPWIHGLTVTDDTLVAVGTIDAHHLDDPPWSPAAVWTSTDGLTWQRAGHDDEVFGVDDDATMRDVVVTEWGLIAVGHRIPQADNPMARRYIGAVWTSPDANRWTRLADDPIFAPGSYAELNALAAGPDRLIAIGSVVTDDAGPTGAVWTSP